VNLPTRLLNNQEPLLVDTPFRHLFLNTRLLPTLKNIRQLQPSSLHPPPPFTNSGKEPRFTQLNKTPPMVLQFPLKAHSVKRSMKLIHKVGSSLMLTETRSVTGLNLTQTQMSTMRTLSANVRLRICSDMAKFRELSMEAERLRLLDVLLPAIQPLVSLSIIRDRHMVQVLRNGLLSPVITTQQDCPMYWRRTSEVEQAPVKSAEPEGNDLQQKAKYYFLLSHIDGMI
jgi:hypothetical protein